MLLGIIAWQMSMLELMFLGVAALEGVATILNWYITSVMCFSNTISRLEMCLKILITVDPAKI